MPALLLLQTLLQRLHQLVEAAQGLDLGLLLVGQELLGQQPQPVLGNVGGQVLTRAHRLQPLEHLGEHLIEPVIVLLVLDQHRPRQMVKGLDVPAGHVLVHGLHQMEPFLQRNWHTGFAQGGEEGQEHQKVSGPSERNKRSSTDFNAWAWPDAACQISRLSARK
ncbi:hypothetical protein D3C80_1032130 [compost metagenome]